MSDKYKNDKGIYIDVHTDRRGKRSYRYIW